MKVCPVCSKEYSDDIRFCQDDGTTLRALAPAASLVGQVVADRYHVLKKLGEGGMGQVYLAEHVKMGRRSAIKVMSPAMVHDPDAIARFNREAANASRITHPNVCAVYDFGETPDGLIYLAMEFVEGEPLTDLLEREGAMPLPRATSIFKQTADALQAAHDLGIVHRDLKPDNIMVARGREGADLIKVVDFGIAKAVGGDEAGQKVTKTGLVVGTPEFMSPEQLSGDKVDGRSDLYSLALVYFRTLTGQLPFQADSAQEVMIKRLTDEPQKLAAARPDGRFPEGLQEVLDAALTRMPGDRYQTVAKFAEDVLGVVQLKRATRGGVASATRADVVEERTQLLDSKQTKAQAAGRAPRKRSMVPVIAGVVAVLGVGGGAWAVLGTKGTPAVGDSSIAMPDTTIAIPDTTKFAAPDTGRRGADVGRPMNSSSGTRDTGRRVTPGDPPPRATGIDPAKAGDILDALIDRPPRVILDSAPLVFDTPGVSTDNRAFAACLSAQAERTLGNREAAVRWAQAGLRLKGSLASCQDVIQNPSTRP